ncbi:MAG: hypothetical protein PHY09_00990 [Desulfuromonadaceae bacterium]|nr:hypothetical protein [Desulfuromonadaceae bacterium]MDD5104891.1 hypothetical protein [Desulfuromonadaceae bacterium]
MQKVATYLIVCALFLGACIAGCGSGSSTPVEDTYSLPASLAPPSPLMGGSIQRTPLVFNNYSVATLAGTAGQRGFSNYSTSNGPPATFNHPAGITTDGTDIYVADYYNNMIRQINIESKKVSLFAGNVYGGAGRTDGTGTTATFYHPSDITTDGTNLYVTDFDNNSVRVINIVSKAVTTIGSTGGYAGSVDSTDATEVRFNRPSGITTDGVNLYVTDFNNATVRRIDIATRAVTTLAGLSGTVGTADGKQRAARFNRPGRITTNGTSIFVTDFYNRTIRRIDILTGEVTTIAGTSGRLGSDDGALDGISTTARFNQPNGITTDGTFLYVTDSYKNTIRKISIASGEVTTIPLPENSLHTPIGVTTDGTTLFVADTDTLNTDNTRIYSNSIISIK